MKIEIEITRDDYVSFNFYHFRKRKLLKTIISALIGLLIVQFAININKSTVSVETILMITFLYVGIFSLLMYMNLVKTKEIPKDSGTFLGWKRYDFTDDYIFFQHKDSDGRFQWTVIKSVEEDKKAIYLYVDTIMAIVIPKRYFGDKMEAKTFIQYIQDKANLASHSAWAQSCLLQKIKPELARKFHVKSLGLFGSVVRDDFSPTKSDIHIIVEFSQPIGIEFVDLADYLELQIRRKVDLISKNGVKENFYKEIEREIIYV